MQGRSGRWMGLVLGLTVAACAASGPARADCEGYKMGEVCYVEANFGPGESDSSTIMAVSGGAVVFAVALANSSELSIGFSMLGNAPTGSWLEVAGRAEVAQGASVSSGSCRVIGTSDGYGSCAVSADPGADRSTMTVELLRNGTVVQRRTSPAGRVASMQGWPSRFTVHVDALRRTVYTWGFVPTTIHLNPPMASAKSQMKTAAPLSLMADEVRVSITGRPIAKLSTVDVRGVVPGGLRLAKARAF